MSALAAPTCLAPTLAICLPRAARCPSFQKCMFAEMREWALQGGQTADFVGAVRVFGIADKLIFEQLTRLDQEEMLM